MLKNFVQDDTFSMDQSAEDFEKKLKDKIAKAEKESIERAEALEIELNKPVVTPTVIRKFAGLGNQGATCYMNSLLQALYMSPEFRSMIYKWEYDSNKNAAKKDCIIYQLQKLFGTLQMLSTQMED